MECTRAEDRTICPLSVSGLHRAQPKDPDPKKNADCMAECKERVLIEGIGRSARCWDMVTGRTRQFKVSCYHGDSAQLLECTKTLLRKGYGEHSYLHIASV